LDNIVFVTNDARCNQEIRPLCNTAQRTHQFKVHKINCTAEILMDKVQRKPGGCKSATVCNMNSTQVCQLFNMCHWTICPFASKLLLKMTSHQNSSGAQIPVIKSPEFSKGGT